MYCLGCSILGPLLFLLFISDIYNGIDKDTNIGLYADDTKIWRKINSESDCAVLQNDIDTLFNWSSQNKMHFHLDKCKALQIHESEPLCTKVLPLAKFYYSINNNIIDYSECEKDLGVLVNTNFKWNDHQLKVLNTKFFDLNDLILFHKIVYEKVPISLPNFIHRYSGHGRLRQTNLDSLSFVSHINSDHINNCCRSPFYKSFYHKILHT